MQRPVKGLIVHKVRGRRRRGAHRRRACTPRSTPSGGVGACQAHSGTHVVHAALRAGARPDARCRPARTTSPATCASTSPGARRSSPATPQRDRGGRQRRACARTCRCRPTYMPLPRPASSGAMALFGETYGERGARRRDRRTVVARAVRWHPRAALRADRRAHPASASRRSGSGVRRVEAFVGMDALRYLAKERALVAELTELLKVPPRASCPSGSPRMLARLKDAEREIEQVRQRAGAWRPAGDARRAAPATSAASRCLGARRRRGRRRRPAHAGAGPARPARRPSARASSRSPVWPRAARSSSWPPTSAARERGIRAGDLVRVAAAGPRRRRRRQGRRRPGRRHRTRQGRRGARRAVECARRASSPADAATSTRTGVRLGVDVGTVRVGRRRERPRRHPRDPGARRAARPRRAPPARTPTSRRSPRS